jgi:hypothetical protein
MSIAEKLVTIAENEQRVYDKGFEDGKAEGGNTEEAYNKGVEDGKQAEYDAFWNAYQENGNKTIYGYSFAGTGWNSENYKPKYPIVLNHPANWNVSVGMFIYFDRNLRKPSLEIHEGDIDFSGKIYTMSNMFSNANISVVEMNAIPTTLDNMIDTFRMYDIGRNVLHTIKIGVREETTYGGNNFKCVTIQNVSFVEGSVIGQNISFQYCNNLTHDSLMNIISVLKDYSGTGTTRTLTLHANAKAILTDSEKAIATQKGWTIA